jgi:hypothetical protein
MTTRQLRPHQANALQRLRNGSVLAGGVGSGKTTTALAYYVRDVSMGVLDRSVPMQTPKDLIVITTAKKRDELDWEAEALHYGIFRDPANSYGHKEFIIDSWNNIKKYVNRENSFFIFDEQRLVGAGAWVKSFLKIVKKNEWVLLTATPADTWMDLVPVFIAHGFYRNRSDFIDKHVVWSFHGHYRKIRGFYGVRHLEKLRDQIVVSMPYEKHTTRHLFTEPVEYDKDLFDLVWKRRWHVLSYEHPRMVIFYNFDYELELLRTLMTRLDIPITEWNGHRHEAVPGTERWIYLVQYMAGSEGWNCTTTNAIVFYSLTYSHKQFEQAQGRIDRLDSPFEDLYYYILMSKAKVDGLIWKALVAKKNFHEGRNVRFVSE